MRVQLLGSSSSVTVRKTSAGLQVLYPESAAEEVLPVLRLQFSEPVRLPESDFPAPGPD